MIRSAVRSAALLLAALALAGGGIATARAAEVSLAVKSDWGSGLQAEVTIENDTDETVRGWRLSFDFDRDITAIWNARLLPRSGEGVVVENAGWNATIAPGGTVSFGFLASPGGSFSSPAGFVLNGEPTGGTDAPPSPPAPPTPPPAPTERSGIVSERGALSVVGGRLVDRDGTPIQLRGMSSHGLQWFGEFANESSIRWLRDDWRATVVRAAMYTDPDANGYVANRSLKEKVYEVVDAAIALDLYVIVDWHILKDNDPNLYRDEALDFFEEVSARYAGVPNVLYEIANEPNPAGPAGEVTWRDDVKPYAEALVPLIRANAPDSVVLVGSSTWSQDVDVAAAAPLAFANVAYTVHFYACTHGQGLRDKVDRALAAGAAVFASEWGATRADGDGDVCADETRTWIDFLDERGIGWVNWSLADKDEASAALVPGADESGGWGSDELSRSGRLVRELMRD